MSLHWDTLRSALVETRELDEQITRNINDMLDLSLGNLRKASAYKLKKLKRALASFDARTGKWNP